MRLIIRLLGKGLLKKNNKKKIDIFCCFFLLLLLIKNIKTSSFKSSENIQKKEGGPDRSVPDNQSSSVTLNELAMKARKML